MEIAQQNGSVWLGPCQSTHKKHSTGENKQPLISGESPQRLGKAAKTRHQLLSAGNLLWKSEGRERKLVGIKGKQGRNQERRGAADCLSNASYPTLSILWKMKEGKHTPKLLFYLCNVMGMVPMGISHALSHSLNSSVWLCVCVWVIFLNTALVQ